MCRPPGSGKTKTIVAFVGALLTDSLRDNGTTIQAPKASNILDGQNQNIPTSKKLLVCAPSNAAVDELVLRFKEGIKTRSGQTKKVNVVRLGRSDAVNSGVKDVVLDELVNAKLRGDPKDSGNQREETQKLMAEHKEISATLRDLRDRLDADQAKGKESPPEVKEKFDAARRRKTQLGSQVEQAMDKEKSMGRLAELERKKAQQDVLDGANIICATLSGSGHDMFQNLNIEFETVVVDEAAQCVEMSALIPLKYGCAKCILVGDPKQLPPTVFSREAARFSYEQSLFVRMQINHPEDIHLLDTQYRMHPEISVFPSNAFYDGRLLDGPDMAGLRVKPWHSQPLLGPYRFFDVQGQHSAAPKGHSLINIAEIDVAVQLFEKLKLTCSSSYDLKGKIGIITPYKSQLRELKTRFQTRYGPDILEAIEFNTTDAFQGRESEVIIFSCVRASPAGGVGFLQDIRRMNVGLTRAKSSLWVLGNSDSLMRGEYWRKLIEDSKLRDRHSSASLIASISGSGHVPHNKYPDARTTGKAQNNVPAVAPMIARSVLIKQEDDTMDIDLTNGSQRGSLASSRKSSASESSRAVTQAIKHEPLVKQEPKIEFAEKEDVEMQDVSDLEVPKVKEEGRVHKRESDPPTSNPGFLVPRTTAPTIVKRKKAPANPLLQPKRPKKPKTE
jgi:senataxin